MSVEPARYSNGRWRRGHSGNPAGRRAETDPERRRVRELARECTEDAVDALHRIVLDSHGQPMAIVRAAEALLTRGWGAPSDEATVAALDCGPDDANIRFVWPMSLDGVEIEEGELVDDEPPALPPAAG